MGRRLGIVALAFGVLACSSGRLASQIAWQEGEATPDGCLIISAGDVSAVSGLEIVTAQPILHDEPGCLYMDAEGLVLSTRFASGESARRNFDAEKAKASSVGLPEIGAEAIWIEKGWAIWSMRGETLVMLGVGKIGETPERLALAKKLATEILPRFQ